MTKLLNSRKDSLLVDVEFTSLPEGNFTFFHARNAQSAEKLKAWLTSTEIGEHMVAETMLNGSSLLVMHGDLSSSELRKKLAARGEVLEPEQIKEPFNAWKWRGNLSNLGQSLNLISSYRKPGGIDAPKMMFAGLNFAASFINATFGGQKSEDEYQLLHLKKDINHLLAEDLPKDCTIPDIHDDRDSLRHDPPPPKTLGDKFHDTMQANSVRVGEIGLRYLGSIAMAFPLKNWKGGAAALSKGGLGEAFAALRNKDSTNFYTGMTYLTGKTIGLFSKVPDPYSPEPHTWVDTVREKYLFRVSSAVETGAATVLAVGNLKAGKNGQRDYIGAAGGASLMAGLMTRLFAKFGTREVDMDELYAHTTDALAQAHPEQLPQMIADCAASIKNHFGGAAEDYGQIYLKLMTDLYHYHHIAVSEGSAPTEIRTAPQIAEKPSHSAAHLPRAASGYVTATANTGASQSPTR